MKRAAEKLKSTRGASILLALVFVLVCTTVGASVLMAAATNAGRTRSNHEEQQLYLALSSSLQLVADDLDGAVYTAYLRDAVTESHPTKTDPATGVSSQYTEYTHTVSFDESACTLNNAGNPTSLSSLFLPYLNKLFADAASTYLPANFPDGPDTTYPENVYDFTGVISTAGQDPPFTLTMAPAAGTPLDGYETVVEVDIDDDFRIELTARMTKTPDGAPHTYAQSFYLTTTLDPTRHLFDGLTLPSTSGTYTSTVTWTKRVITSGNTAS